MQSTKVFNQPRLVYIRLQTPKLLILKTIINLTISLTSTGGQIACTCITWVVWAHYERNKVQTLVYKGILHYQHININQHIPENMRGIIIKCYLLSLTNFSPIKLRCKFSLASWGLVTPYYIYTSASVEKSFNSPPLMQSVKFCHVHI